MAGSGLIDFLNGYEKDPKYKTGGRGVKSFFSRSYSGSVTGRLNSIVAKTSGIGNNLTRVVTYTSSAAYGAALLTYGVISIILYFLVDYFSLNSADTTYSVIVGIIAAALSVPLLFSDKPLGTVLQSNRVCDFIFFEFFCIKRPISSENGRGVPMPLLCFLLGLLALGGFFVPSHLIAFGLLSLLIVYLTLISPECTFLISIMLLPYLGYIPYSEIVFSVLTVLTVISFLRKVVCGKRVIFFEQYDFFLSLMMIAILLSGIFIKGMESFTSSLTMIAMSMGYLLAGNLLTNRRLADCALNALSISSIPASVYSVYLLISALSRGEGAAITGHGISSTFASTDLCAIYLIVASIAAVALAKQSSGAPRVSYFAVSVLNFAALVLTGELFAILALLIGFAAYPILKMRAISPVLLIVLVFLPYLFFALPDDVMNSILAYVPSISEASELRRLWGASLNALSGNLLTGVGMGEESFALEMEKYGVYGFVDSKNLFIELGLEAGIFALVFFAILLIVRLRHGMAYRSYLKHSQVGTIAPFISCMVVALVAYGSTEYIWNNGPSFFLFWCIFGMGSAMLRIAKKEVDDRTLYYEDARDVDYSAIDIEIA